jgi:hypothetical protein
VETADPMCPGVRGVETGIEVPPAVVNPRVISCASNAEEETLPAVTTQIPVADYSTYPSQVSRQDSLRRWDPQPDAQYHM